jgi:DNA modification methylase
VHIELWPIDRAKDYPKNARKWSAQAIEKVASSIREYGWRQPVVVDANEVIVIGHLRRAGGKFLGLTEVPVHVASDLTPSQVRGLRLMDNRSHEEAEWDLSLLAPELADLSSLDFDLTLTGFDVNELDALLHDPLDDERADQAPPLPEVAATRLGDLWLCGAHRVLCGDATSEADVAHLLDRRNPFLMVTDPPYGVNYDPKWRAEAGVNKNLSKLGDVSNDHRADWREAWEFFKGPVAYVWHAGRYASTVQASLEAVGFEVRSQIIWAKDRFALSRGHYHWQHEPCWYAVRGTAHWMGDRSQNTLWNIKAREDSGHGHGTQKPVECMRRPIVNHTKRGDAIYDPFLGSGTTMMAAELAERVCYGIDIDPQYVDVAVIRWQDFTGANAILEGDGRTFEQVKTERLGIAA